MMYQGINNETKQTKPVTKKKNRKYTDRFLVILIIVNAVAIIIASMDPSQTVLEPQNVQIVANSSMFSEYSGGFIAILGIALTAIPIGLLASGFSKNSVINKT